MKLVTRNQFFFEPHGNGAILKGGHVQEMGGTTAQHSVTSPTNLQT